MADVDPSLWRDMMDYLRQRHGDICRQWFTQLEPIDFETGLLRIATRDSVQQNYLQKKCLAQFQEAAQQVTGALVSVCFVFGADAVPRSPRNSRANMPRPTAARMPSEWRPGDQLSGASNANTNLNDSDDDADSGDAHDAGENQNSNMLPNRHGDEPQHPALNPEYSLSRNNRASFDSMFDGTNESPSFADEIILSPDYTFENFVVGSGNRLAHAASVAVANKPGLSYNPLFIHGDVGLGKTHLLQAICQALLVRDPNCRICYLSCDAFMNDFMECVQRGQMAQFRERYRHVDVLVIDDIHFLANRERTQEEFFHTFNALYQSRKQIVLSSDSPPHEIPQLEDRLISRFAWGLVAPVSELDYETRLAIVRSKAEIRGFALPDDVAGFIATKVDSNARELEGAIITVQGHAAVAGNRVDMAMAQEALGNIEGMNEVPLVTLQQIIDVVTSVYGVKLSDLQSKRRHKSITEPRQVCMWLARKHLRYSLQEIGGYFGGRDHTTVMHAEKTVEQRSKIEPRFADLLKRCDDMLSTSR